jgi:hypothetical protein
MSKNLLRAVLLLCCFSMSLSCNKSNISPLPGSQEDLVILAMTSGKWFVKSFSVNGNDSTSRFASYEFQYYSDKTVDAIKNNSSREKGNWDGNSSNMTTYANFPAAVNPLIMINGTWKIDRNSWTFVEASQTNGSEVKRMRLEKR